jgi:hypothetical protein
MKLAVDKPESGFKLDPMDELTTCGCRPRPCRCSNT